MENTMTPTPGVPLSAESVKLLKAGDRLMCPVWGVVRFDRFDDSERRAFVLDIENNQVRLMSPAKMTFIDRPATPSDQGEGDGTDAYRRPDTIAMLTTPASGSDGLETVAWRWRWTAESYGQPGCKPGRWNYTEDGECGDARVKDIQPLVTREAAEKRIGELEAQVRSAVEAAQPVLSGEFSALQSQVAALKAALGRALELHQVTHIHAMIRQALALKKGR